MSAVYKFEEGQRIVEGRYRDLLARWPVPSEQRSVATSFGDTFVVICGPPSALPVVLLQGSGANAAMWLGDIATVSASHRVYCMDVIGEPGLSAPSRPRLDARTYACWLREVFDGLGLSSCGACVSGGLSMNLAILDQDAHAIAGPRSVTDGHRDPRSTIVTSVWTKSSPLKRSGSPVEIASAYEKQSP